MNIKPISRKQNIVVQELENELLVYDLQTNKAFCLNETSAMIFQLCDGKRSVSELADALSIKLKTLVSEDFVRLTLHELNRDGLLENPDEIKTYLNGINRREIVKKIGLASLIALPIVSSVIAPSAAMAASGQLSLLAACSANPDCASGFCNPCNGTIIAACPGPKHCCANSTGTNTRGYIVENCQFIGPCNGSVCCSGSASPGPRLCITPNTQACYCD